MQAGRLLRAAGLALALTAGGLSGCAPLTGRNDPQAVLREAVDDAVRGPIAFEGRTEIEWNGIPLQPHAAIRDLIRDRNEVLLASYDSPGGQVTLTRSGAGWTVADDTQAVSLAWPDGRNPAEAFDRLIAATGNAEWDDGSTDEQPVLRAAADCDAISARLREDILGRRRSAAREQIEALRRAGRLSPSEAGRIEQDVAASLAEFERFAAEPLDTLQASEDYRI